MTPAVRASSITLLSKLCKRIGSLNPAVKIEPHVGVGLWLDADQVIPLALIAVELLTNVLRHAFSGEVAGVVRVAAWIEESVLIVRIVDDAMGMPLEPVRPGLGTTVIQSLARRIQGSVQTDSQPGKSMSTTIRLVLPEMAVLDAVPRRLTVTKKGKSDEPD